MKNILYIFLLSTQVFWAQSAFEKGNDLYQKGQYEKAAESYETIIKSGQQSAELYFNLGNCYYKMHKVAPSVFNFEKALLLNPNDSEIQNNLAFAQKMAIDDITEVPTVGFAKIIQDFTSGFHYDTWAWVAVALSVLFLLCFVGYYFSSKTGLKRIFFTSMLFVLLFAIVSVFAGFLQKNHHENDRPAVVFAEVASVKSEPNSAAPEAFALHAGTKVYVLESLNNYKKIRLLDQKEGWIEKSAIKELK
ncbi:tetratricopeptide repeat protein [Flavobacterium humi]|uniref:Tetratricopeptide repeat protein n=1 Tax=Flavobacterium humi TaxID=2562683 RepID=A0A4Z0L897_9FLAO|nr:tetratricopeptide repeat protein [Flavobacterium humi]TGD58530.1 tetratricopeptide repeat protein [Flavobacterium humi]